MTDKNKLVADHGYGQRESDLGQRDGIVHALRIRREKRSRGALVATAMEHTTNWNWSRP
jgi:hypothetical protein